jgi:hypothetical protein
MGAGCCSSKFKVQGLNSDLEWKEMMKNYKIESLAEGHSLKLKDLAFRGIPSYLRWEVWGKLLNFTVNREEYQEIIKEMTADSQIDKDIHRTFPGDQFIASEEGQKSLKNLLNALAGKLLTGYWQGMNYITAVALLQSSRNEEESFAFLISFFNTFQVIRLFDEQFKVVRYFCQKFHEVLEKEDKKLENHLKNIGLDDSLWIFKWFITVFSYSFSYRVVLRVWDALLVMDLKYLVNIAVGVALTVADELISKSLEEILPFLDKLELDVDKALQRSRHLMILWDDFVL